MNIHTVRVGDTVFKIARQYSASPMKIIENNGLEAPDRLCVGQELLVLTPTKTHSVRGSETLEKIAQRFDVGIEDLMRQNPYLKGTDKVYHGQNLALKHDTPPYQRAFANGYYYKNTPMERLVCVLPHLTYVTVGVGKRYGKDIHLLFDDTDVLREVKRWKREPLMRVVDTDGICFEEAYLENLATLTKSRGYSGLVLASHRAQKENPEGYKAFLRLLKNRLCELGLTLFVELDANGKLHTPEGCDGYFYMYERAPLDSPEGLDLGEEKFMRACCDCGAASRSFLELPSYAYMNDEAMTKREAERIAYNAGVEIKTDAVGINRFAFNKYRGGKRESVEVRYESLKNIKAKLDLVGKHGFMGICFDIGSVPTEYLMLFEVTFAGAPYSCGGM